jgi:hypothetical protein
MCTGKHLGLPVEAKHTQLTHLNLDFTPCEVHGPGFEPCWSKGFYLLYTRPDRPWLLSSLLYSGYRGCFPGLKVLGWR